MPASIVKVQRPLPRSGATSPAWLIYDRERHVNEYIAPEDLPIAVLRAMGEATKAYFYAQRDADGRLIFGSPASAQPW